MSSDNLYQDPGPIRDPRKDLITTTALLKRHFGYTDPKVLGAGAFGSVVRFKNPKKEEEVAIKLLYLNNTSEGEKKIWIRLRHQNIVPLRRCTVFRPLNVVCYEMQVCPYDLVSAVRKAEYLDSPESLRQLKRWLHQVLCGLDFLHNRQLCHLDVKPDNVLISRRANRAMLGDFTFLNRTTSQIGRDEIGLPIMYRPPEASSVLKNDQSIDGRYFDLWTFGVMSMELLTNFHMVRSFSCRLLDIEARQASMRRALQEDTFTDKMKKALPAVELTPDDIQMALNFIHSFLRYDPSARTTADVGMQHTFLGKGDFVSSGVDALWQRPSKFSKNCLFTFSFTKYTR
ncbi:hypothetical protein AVEN_196390-1 [Araneus ventricosus]|uniref:Protein kinase domain-containing protein n=1 Tax=Araneus ventricosus TaxID=182803 RepID=A0A4Y2AU32_ARAVE|nr:hypothetical protein AVEN_196390-1 [Araneus ventricosus]